MRPASPLLLAWLFAAATGAAACGSERVEAPPPPPVDWRPAGKIVARDAGPLKASTSERGTADAYIKALASPGFADLPKVLDEEAHFTYGSSRDTRGRELVIKAHDDLFGAFDQRSFTVSRVWLTDASQGIEWTMSGVQARAFMGVPPAKKPVTFRGMSLLWTKDDGTITDEHVYFDAAVVKAQIGAGTKDLLALPHPTAPTAPRTEVETTGTVEETENVAKVRASLDALEGGDEAAYVATMTDDVEVWTAERAQPVRGKEAARAYFRAMRKAIAHLDTTVSSGWGFSSAAVVEYTIAGEQRGPIWWIPPGRDPIIKMSIVDVVELSGGKIARITRYDNPSEILLGP